MGRGNYRITFLFFLIFFFSPCLCEAASPGEINRNILALYKIDVAQGDNLTDTHLHRRAEVILNHLGLEVTYASIDEDLPTHEAMKKYRGILTWFPSVEAVAQPRRYCKWLREELEQGRKAVILGYPGVQKDPDGDIPYACSQMFESLGVTFSGLYSDNPYYFEITYMDSEMMEFERKMLLTEGITFSKYVAKDPQSKIYFRVRRKDQKESDSDLVFTTSHGGFAHPGSFFFYDEGANRFHWRLNPFRFFNEAFSMQSLPRPDTTTLNGTRIFYAHIDGDGIVNVSNIDNESYSGEIIYNEILKKYLDVPTTASIITGYLEMKAYQNERVMNLYRDMFSLPNVQPAAHGHSHPLDWHKNTLALKVPGYRYSDEAEILGSVFNVRGILSAYRIGKNADLFLWTGNCNPSEKQIAVTYTGKLLNMNGGDTRFDRRYDSYGFVMPLGILRGVHRQIYSSNSNENTYTYLWNGPFYGFRDLTETFQRTESPIRIKPMNIYYHYYSGEKVAALNALQQVYDFALSQKPFPIFSAEYVDIVNGFFSTKMETLPGGFRITDNGALKTIRFDDETRNVDMRNSGGVLGFQHYQGSLYVFLDEKAGPHTIILTHGRPLEPYLVRSTFRIRKFEGNQQVLRFQKKGWYKSEITLGGMLPDTFYTVREGERSNTVKSGSTGDLAIVFQSTENEKDYVNILITRGAVR